VKPEDLAALITALTAAKPTSTGGRP